MNTLARGITELFDGFFRPFGAAGWPALIVISALSSVLLLWLFKITTNQGALSDRRRVLTGHLYELGLYQDDLKSMAKIQFDLFKANLKYLSTSLPALLVLIPVMMVIVVQLDARYQRRGMLEGETALVSVTVAEENKDVLPLLALEPGRDLTVEAGPLVDRVEGLVWWRIRAESDSAFVLAITDGSTKWSKSLHPVSKYGRLTGVRERGGWHHLVLNPSETALAKETPISTIAVDLPRRDSDWAGLPVWLWGFFGVSVLGGLLVKRLLKVEM